MTFEEYLTDKKIDSTQFKSAEEELWNSLREVFDVMHPKSFTAQKLFLINPIRRKYPLTIVAKGMDKNSAKVSKPIIKPSVKPKPAMGRPKLK